MTYKDDFICDDSDASDDPEYDPMIPDASDESDAASDTETSDAESDPETFGALGRSYRIGAPPATQYLTIAPKQRLTIAKADTSADSWMKHLSPEEKSYIKTLSPNDTSKLLEHYKALTQTTQATVPLRFKILTLPPTALPDASKKALLQKLNHYQTMTADHSEYAKYTHWIRSLEQIPFGLYHTLPEGQSVADTLLTVQRKLNDAVFGHDETKHQLLMTMAQWLTNPSSKGRCIGIQGPMGIGKTTLMKDGVSQALGFPFGFIALGGATDAAFLEGHSFTYEGATYGRIVELLMKYQVMNPILFFDELDKLSDSPRGEEISSLLTHLTDPSQNAVFTDKYFGSIELDLSRCLMVFSFNDTSKINPILKDRMTVIHVSGYTADEKIQIARRHLLPRLFQQYNLGAESAPPIVIEDSVLRSILQRIPEEKGIRQFIQALERIVGWINMARYIVSAPFTELLELPFHVKEDHLAVFLKKTTEDGASATPFSMYS
jgi:ATP-dependent Lon protease